MNDQTREAIRQWRAKARSDWTAVEILMASERCPAETVCFHCQQFVEKLLKAFLTSHGIETPKTHDLRRLIQLAEPFAPELSRLSDASDTLTIHGVETRYPGDWRQIEPSEMNQVVELSKQFGDILLPKLEQ
ncbi:MAG TPA: HEPN domain-containing protein [Sedimentisphaerales bacterium]|nr:HEPN domain-containing protein [Sedimentisphaerales bacterium]